jgi:FkbM family methyltransferase
VGSLFTMPPMARRVRKLDVSPVLASLLEEARLVLVDIGARGNPRPELLSLAAYARLVAIEPDADEARRLAGLEDDGSWQDVVVVPAAIAAEVGEATLYRTASPGMSSLLEPDPDVCGRFVNAEAFQVVATSRVPTLPLDLAASRYGFEDGCFLKIDTQGTELEILRSGPNLLANSVAVYTEALFHPFYKGQSLFADVDAHLRSAGFRLAELRRTGLRRAGFRQDLYSERQTTWAHCLFLRDPASLDGDRAIARQICIALAYGQHDIALELAAARDAPLVQAIEDHVRRVTRRRLRGHEPEEQQRLLGKSRRD